MKFKETLTNLITATAIAGTTAISGCADLGSSDYQMQNQREERAQKHAVPEPSTAAFLLTGAGALGAYNLISRKRER